MLDKMNSKIEGLDLEHTVLQRPLPKNCTGGVTKCAEAEGQRILDLKFHKEEAQRMRAEFDNFTVRASVCMDSMT